jgi:prepilin-type processing-associated H-X9-DG protein
VPQNTHRGFRVALTSYVGVLGTNFRNPDGVLFLDSQVRIADIGDGTSHTIMAGERPPSADFWYGWWYAGVGQWGTGSADMFLGAREINAGWFFLTGCAAGPFHFGPGRPDEQCDTLHFWSLHSGGGNFLLADGSVRFLSYEADEILPALASRSGGESSTVPD